MQAGISLMSPAAKYCKLLASSREATLSLGYLSTVNFESILLLRRVNMLSFIGLQPLKTILKPETIDIVLLHSPRQREVVAVCCGEMRDLPLLN